MGADKLLGKGDMLFLQPGTSTLIRAQGTYVERRGDRRASSSYLRVETRSYDSELVQLKTGGDGRRRAAGGEQLQERDELYEQAIEIVIREGRGSVSLLQRALGHRLRPGRPADRLHGRGRHRRRVQRRNAREVLIRRSSGRRCEARPRRGLKHN